MKTPVPPLSRAIVACCTAFAGCSARGGEAEAPCSFSRPPFVHPKVIEDLSTWLSDSGDQVVAINLLDAQGSNRYHGDVLARESPGEAPFVYVREGAEMFGYRHVGTTTSGVEVLRTASCGGGTGVFVNLMLVRLDRDLGVTADWDRLVVRPERRRLLLRKLGEIALGDRWDGTLRIEGDKLFVGKDEGVFAGTTRGGSLSEVPKDRTLRISAVGGSPGQ
jgi:hypothetical protein